MQQIDKEILQNFAKIIKSARLSKSKSLNKFAFNKCEITSATLSRIENGLVDFKFTTLVKLASALDISLRDLFKNFDYKYNLDE